MPINTKNQTQLLRDQASAIQGASQNKLVDFTVGAILRAVIEGNAGIALWLQAVAIKVMSLTRARTSKGADLDTWMADFGLTRLGAQPSLGTVTFSRYTPGAQAVIPIGAEVRTTDAQQSFVVTLDSSNGAYSAGLGGYVMPVGLSSISVPVAAVTPGAASNVLADTVTLIVSNIPYVDTVTNAGALADGSDAETDDALRARFVRYIQSLSRATELAINYAVTSLRLGVSCKIVNNEDYAGNFRPGFFTVVFDDGSGTPSDELFSLVYDAIESYRANTVLFSLHKPDVLTATVAMNITAREFYNENVVIAAVVTSLTSALNAWPLGETLPYTKLAQVAYEASPGVKSVTGITLNGLTSDLVATYRQKIIAGSVIVS